MRRLCPKTALLAGFAGILSAGFNASCQVSAPANPSPAVPVFVAGDGVTAPELLLPVKHIDLPPGKCKNSQTGATTLSFIVDETGMPRNITFLNVRGDDIDKLALHVVATDRFKPATRNGTAVPVWWSEAVSVKTCSERTKDSQGRKIVTVRPGSQPEQQFSPPQSPAPEAVLTAENTSATQPSDAHRDADARLYKVNPNGGLSAPVAINMKGIAAQFSNEARKKRIQGICLLSLIVDRNGLPENIRIVKSLGYGLDENAIEAVSRYRFRPAMKNGIEPVPVMITVEVNYRLY